jgi:uncharacterized membrane protein
MPLIIFAIATAVAFLAADAVVIPLVMQPLFKGALRETMLDDLRLAPAALFYLVHIGGLVWFAGRTALAEGRMAAARDGAIVGLVAYSCYEMTSFTIMRDWRIELVVIDLGWGTFISGFAAFVGATAMARLAPKKTA